MNRDALFSHVKSEWETPQNFFDELNREFSFTLDVCASEDNAKCADYFTVEDDGLLKSWKTSGSVWCNPPYGREIGKWVRKATDEMCDGQTVVMLLPARTDTRWFHEYIYHRAEVRFVKGRLKFGLATNYAPFPSMVVIFMPFGKTKEGEG